MPLSLDDDVMKMNSYSVGQEKVSYLPFCVIFTYTFWQALIFEIVYFWKLYIFGNYIFSEIIYILSQHENYDAIALSRKADVMNTDCDSVGQGKEEDLLSNFARGSLTGFCWDT